MPTPATSHAVSSRIQAVSVVVRDLTRNARHELPGHKPMLRVPYDLVQPEGPAEYGEGMIKYLQGGEVRLGRTAPAPLADAHPGERILLRLPPCKNYKQWWLCEVEEVGR
jgi:hypothetical protein